MIYCRENQHFIKLGIFTIAPASFCNEGIAEAASDFRGLDHADHLIRT